MDSSDNVCDWQGNVVSMPEADDVEILVWQITPDPRGEFDSVIIRGYQDMLTYVEENLQLLVDDLPEDKLREGVSLNIKLVPIRVSDYREAMAASDDV